MMTAQERHRLTERQASSNKDKQKKAQQYIKEVLDPACDDATKMGEFATCKALPATCDFGNEIVESVRALGYTASLCGFERFIIVGW